MKKGVLKKEGINQKGVKQKLFGLSAIILFGIFLVIGIVFYVSLSIIKSGEKPVYTNGGVTLSPDEKESFSFGLEEFIFAIVFALFMVGFLLWTKSMTSKNAYLGTLIGIIGAVILGYAFYLRYKGPYSILFMIVTSVVILIYIGMNFFRYRKEDYENDEE